MKTPPVFLFLGAAFALGGALVALPMPATAEDWARDARAYRGNGGGFWSQASGPGAPSGRMTTAHISQALYGTPPEPYDTSAEPSDREASLTE